MADNLNISFNDNESNFFISNNQPYPKFDKSKISTHYFCSICKQIYNNVHQAECGCRYCLICLETICCKCHKKFYIDKALFEFEIFKRLIDKAFQKEINNIQINCVKCKWSGKLCDYKAHFDENHNPLMCTFCNKIFDNLNEHECELKPVKCPYADIGCCLNSEIQQNNLETHLKDDIKTHLNLVFKYFKENNTRLDDINSLKTRLQAIEYSQKCLCEDLMRSINLNESLNRALEIQRLNETKNKDELNSLKHDFIYAQATILSLEERVYTLENTTYDGMFLWKITNVNEKILNAKNGSQLSIYSPSFYTHKHGYKLCARLYLNGDGMGLNTHVSLFLVILKGEYDVLLKWPFKHKVTFMLIDQLNYGNQINENIVDAFRPDPNSNSFQRPIDDMNIASGLPKFCTLPKLISKEHGYIKDDTMFIEINVDLNEACL